MNTWKPLPQKLAELPLFLALDVDEAEAALALARRLRPFVGGFKLGPRLVLRSGPGFIKEMAGLGSVFVDFKFHDIPSTMEAAIRAVFEAGASFVTIHASAGREALAHLARIEAELNQIRYFKLLAVTLLTSFSETTRPSIFDNKRSILEQVLSLATDVAESGLGGLVCSPHEVRAVKEKWPGQVLVTPGVRFHDEGVADQKRVLEPGAALQLGATALVVGRPILAAPSPEKAAERYAQALRAWRGKS